MIGYVALLSGSVTPPGSLKIYHDLLCKAVLYVFVGTCYSPDALRLHIKRVAYDAQCTTECA